MRVAEHIFVVRGALRSACYDTHAGECWPLADDEARLLAHLAGGCQPATSIVNRNRITPLLVVMRERGWLVPGVPETKSLKLTFEPMQSRASRLAHVWFELTQSCNLSCFHCYAESSPRANRAHEISMEEWIDIANRTIDYGVDTVTFMGGEPTIRLDVAEAIARLVRQRSPDTVLRMFSNFATPGRAAQMEAFIQKFNVRIGTALYGMNAQEHDSMTGVQGSFDRTLLQLRRMQEAGITVFVGMYMDLTVLGVKDACEQWLRELGVNSFEVLAPSEIGRGTVKIWRKKITSNSNAKVLSFTKKHLSGAAAGHNCFKDHFVVKPDGTVSPCIMMRQVDYGTLKDASIESVLASESFAAMARLSKDNIEGCNVCEFRYACFDCRPDAIAGSANVTKKPACGYDPRQPLGAELRE